jgi:hypothetical protein
LSSSSSNSRQLQSFVCMPAGRWSMRSRVLCSGQSGFSAWPAAAKQKPPAAATASAT